MAGFFCSGSFFRALFLFGGESSEDDDQPDEALRTLPSDDDEDDELDLEALRPRPNQPLLLLLAVPSASSSLDSVGVVSLLLIESAADSDDHSSYRRTWCGTFGLRTARSLTSTRRGLVRCGGVSVRRRGLVARRGSVRRVPILGGRRLPSSTSSALTTCCAQQRTA